MTSEGGGGSDDVGRQLQPHLAGRDDDVTAPVHDSDVRVNVGRGSRTPGSWETFDDDDEDEEGAAATSRSSPGSDGAAKGRRHTGDSLQQLSRDDARIGSRPAPLAPNGDSTASNTPKPKSAVDVPVVYHHQGGREVVVVGGEGGGGDAPEAVIQTRYAAERGLHEMDRPLRPGRIKMLKALSIVAAILFFPTGVPAALFAWRIPDQLAEGILQGNIDRALRSARFSQRLVIVSGLLCVLVVVLSLALWQQTKHGHSVGHSYIAHSSVNG